MHQIARFGVLVADGFGFTNVQSGVQIHMPQQRHPVAVEDLRDRRLWQAQVVADPSSTTCSTSLRRPAGIRGALR